MKIYEPKIVCGDNVAALRAMKAATIDLTVTSPPYDNLRTYDGFTWDFESLAREIYRATKPGGVVVWVVGDATIKGSETGTSFRQALFFKEIGFNLHDTMIYRKKNYVPLTHSRYEQCFEYMFILSKGKPKTFNGLKIPSAGITGGSKYIEKNGAVRNAHAKKAPAKEKLRPNIFEYVVGQTRNGHPAVFPAALASDMVSTWSNPGDIVLDPFAGSGTTLLTACALGRKSIGVEISAKYCELIAKRLRG